MTNTSSMEMRMSATEKLDDQLRNGTDYINLPAQLFPTDRAPTWTRPAIQSKGKSQQENRFLHHLRPSTTVSQIHRDHSTNQQQIDARNRLQHLETIRPKENINLLNFKFRSLQHPRHPRPALPQYRDDYVNTFYDQTGRFVQERAGLYHTDSYEPSALARALPELANKEDKSSSSTEKTSSKLFQTRALGNYQTMRDQLLKKLSTSFDASAVDSRVQEGEQQNVQCQTTYGQAYNTPKFLQENTLAYHARTDPARLMSTRYNTTLNAVRNSSSFPNELNAKTPAQSPVDLVSPALRPATTDELYATDSIGEHTNGYSRRATARVYDSPFQTLSNPSLNQPTQQANALRAQSFDPKLSVPKPIPNSVKTAIRLPGPEIVARIIEPTFLPRTTYRSSFKDLAYREIPPQTANFRGQNQPYSSDNRLKQLRLKDIQDRWSKSQALQQYHLEHPEPIPDVGGNTIRARKEILIADTLAKRAELIIR